MGANRSGLAKSVESPRPHEDMFATLADNISQLAWMADSNGSIFWYNKRWFDYTGTTLRRMQGWGWTKVHHPDHVERVVDRIRRSFESGEPWEDTFPLRAANGQFRWFLSRAMPIRDEAGQIVRWFGTHTDISDQRQIEERLRESEATFRAMFNNSSLGKAQVDVSSRRFTRANEALCRLVDASPAELLAATFPEIVHAASRPALEGGLDRLARGEIAAFGMEARLDWPAFERHRANAENTCDSIAIEVASHEKLSSLFPQRALPNAGRRVWAQITINTIVDEKGAPYRFAVVVVDATERKLAEQRNLVLMREVNHRAKNLLAVVQAIARQTAGSEDFEERFLDRVVALAAAHDVVVENEWQGATLERLLLSQTSLFADPQSRRIALSGPPALVSAEASQMIAMAIYELATNAVKYGALSTDAGRVFIGWSVAGDKGAKTFVLEWRETDGPMVGKPLRSGFGSIVTRRLIASRLDAKVDARFMGDGFVWRLTCPLASIVGREAATELDSVSAR